MPDNLPATPHPLLEVTSDRIARHLGETASATFKANIWPQIAAPFAEAPALLTDIDRLRATLANARLDRANLAAAALAAIFAYHDGDPDPLSYLRDELGTQGYDIQDCPCRGRGR
jgi:hypothetical protein